MHSAVVRFHKRKPFKCQGIQIVSQLVAAASLANHGISIKVPYAKLLQYVFFIVYLIMECPKLYCLPGLASQRKKSHFIIL